MVTGIEGGMDRSFAPCHRLLYQLWRGHTKSIVRNGEGIRAPQLNQKRLPEFFLHAIGQNRFRLGVHTENLLCNTVSPAGEKACFSRCGPALHAMDAGDVDAFAPEISDQSIAGRVIAYGGYRQD